MLFAACISLSSVLPQQGQTNILSFNVSVSFNVPHLEQYFVVGNHLFKTTTLSLRASLDLRRPRMLWCILDDNLLFILFTINNKIAYIIHILLELI